MTYPYNYTTQRELRRAFWEQHPGLSRKKVNGDYHVDTRQVFVAWIDYLERSQLISPALAERATL